MNRIFRFLILIVLGCTACNDNGEIALGDNLIPVICIGGAIVFGLIIYGKQSADTDEQKKKARIQEDISETEEFAVKTERYIGGHPDIDEVIENSWLVPTDKEISIQWCKPNAYGLYRGAVTMATLPTNQVKAIKIEDASTIERKVTLGRFIMLGALGALAFKKKVKTETAYLTIDWNDGRFDHETSFEFSGNGAFQRANHARNRLIKLCRSSVA